MERVVTFDFHNTIAHCDPWFDLEVRTLPGSVYQWLAQRGDVPPALDIPPAANRGYRLLRERIVASGDERDAVACVEEVFESLAITVPRAAVREGVDALMRDALTSLQAVPGAVATVRGLRAAGCRLGVVSSAVHHGFLDWSLAVLGIADAFDVVTSSASSGFYKSRPEIYSVALAAMGATPHGSVHVGDSLRWDVGGAQRAGMKGAWLRRASANTDRYATSGPPPTPDLVLDSLVGATPALLTLLDEY
jgi:FMN phosphatase YigB (HAD superfamily)